MKPVVLLLGSAPRGIAHFEVVPLRSGNPLSLAIEIMQRGAHVVHITGALDSPLEVLCLLTAKLLGTRVVVQLPRLSANGFLGLADAIIVRSAAEMRALPGQNVAIVAEAIDTAPYFKYNRRPADPAAPLRLLAFDELPQALEALGLLRSQGVEPQLVMTGNAQQPLAKRLGVTEQVIFAGPAIGEYKVKLLNNADVLIMGSPDETLGLEAMAAGVVPLSGDARSMAGAIAKLDADRAELARMSQGCRQRIAADHSLERLADDLTAIYSILIPWPASQAG